MRRTKEGTIAYYKPEFIANKTQEQIQDFESSSIERQYYTIMNWKRSVEMKGQSVNAVTSAPTFSSFLKLLNDASKELEKLSDISSKEEQKANAVIDIIKSNLSNFDKIKKQRKLSELLKQEKKLQKEIASVKESLNN